jgi:hypothetical protein
VGDGGAEHGASGAARCSGRRPGGGRWAAAGEPPWRWSVAGPELGLETVLAHHAGHGLTAVELRRAVYGSARSWRQKVAEPSLPPPPKNLPRPRPAHMLRHSSAHDFD